MEHFITLFSAENGKRPKTISAEALAYFLAYDWPGNVRELRNMVERLVIMTPARRHRPRGPPAAAPPAGRGAGGRRRPARAHAQGGARGLRARLHPGELRANEWNMTRTAERLGIERSHLYRKLKAYGISAPK